MRAFVIGNGGSLAETPLELLEREFTVGCNRFDLLNLPWEPNIWVMQDVHHDDEWWDWEDLLSRDTQFLFREQDREWLEPQPNVEFTPRCDHIGGKYVPLEWHLPDYCDYGGSISVGLQAAVKAGAEEIYLVGCDLYEYRGPQDVDINHFDDDYCPYKIKRGEELIGPEEWENLNRRLIIGHKVAQATAGVPIYNATVGGKLEVYPRVDIHDLLHN